MHIALLPRRSFHGKLIGVSLYQFLFLIVCRSGGLANVFGRRPILLGGLLFFAVGSAMCGAAVNMKYVIYVIGCDAELTTWMSSQYYARRPCLARRWVRRYFESCGDRVGGFGLAFRAVRHLLLLYLTSHSPYI